MSEMPNKTRWERLHERLDDELPPSERAQLERELAADPTAAAEAKALDALAHLARRARAAAPAGFSDSVMQAIAAEERSADAGRALRAPEPRSLWARLFGTADGTAWLRPGLAGALALAALAVAAALLWVRLENLAPNGAPASELATSEPVASEPVAGPGASESAGDDETPGAVELVTHRFVLQAPGAQKVCLVGDFNEWKLCEVPMTRDASGHWVADVRLPRGRHQYMFVVDDREWQSDPQADVKVDDGFGNQNAVVFL